MHSECMQLLSHRGLPSVLVVLSKVPRYRFRHSLLPCFVPFRWHDQLKLTQYHVHFHGMVNDWIGLAALKFKDAVMRATQTAEEVGPKLVLGPIQWSGSVLRQ